MDDQEIILLDTDITIDLLRKNAEVVLLAHQLGAPNLFINSVVRMEVLYKAVDKKDLTLIKRLLEALPSLPLESAISEIAETLFENYILSHRPAIPDMLIAATCINYDIPLLTFNKKDYRYIKGLKLVQHDCKPMARKPGTWFG